MGQVAVGALQPVQQVQRLGLILHPPAQPLQARLAALQQVAALVGKLRRHLPDGGQALGLQRLLLRLLQLGDVVPDKEHSLRRRRPSPRPGNTLADHSTQRSGRPGSAARSCSAGRAAQRPAQTICCTAGRSVFGKQHLPVLAEQVLLRIAGRPAQR